MLDRTFGPSGDRWWADLEPQVATRRPDLMTAFARRSLERFKESAEARPRIDVKSLTNQLNGFAVELVKKPWAKPTFTADGVRVMEAEVKDARGYPEDLRGWASVLEALGRICDPLAHYVVSFYPPLYDMRPVGLPRDVMSSLKDRARYNACIALRAALLSGIGQTGPLFDSEDRTFRFIDAISQGAPPDADLHEREVILAFAAELDAYARRIGADPSRVMDKESTLMQSDVAAIADVIANTADGLRQRYADDVPTLSQSADRATALLTLVDAHITSILSEINRIESALIDQRGSTSRQLDKWKMESEYFTDAKESTRDELILLLSRGHQKTEHDAYLMFKARVGGALRRAYAAKWHTRPTEVSEISAPAPSADSRYSMFKKTLLEDRDDVTGGFGRLRDGDSTAEFDAVAALFDREATDLDEIEEFCQQYWSDNTLRAVADNADLFTQHVIEIIRWTAIRSGLR